MFASRSASYGTKRESSFPTRKGKLSFRSDRDRASCVRVVAAVKSGAENGIVFHQTLVARSGEEESVRDVCQKRSEASLNATGANKKTMPVDVRLEQDAADPNVFFIWERYPSQLAMVQHQKETEYVQWLEEVRPFLEEPVRMVLYEYKDGMLGVPSVYLGPKGEGGLDDATGAAGTNAGASYNQQMQIDLGNIRRGDEGDSFGMDSSR